MDRRARALLLAVAGALVLGCSGSPTQKIGLPGGAPCQGPLEVVGAPCPQTFDGTLASVACPPYFGQELFSCGDALLLLESGGSTAAWCVYDPSSHALVGATVTSDAPEFCGGLTYQERAGKQVDPACALGDALDSRVCPASGLDAAPPDAAADGGDGGGMAPDGGAPDGADGDGVSE
ncbi:MAG TPA: hypothetical protein VHL80_20480 [Polyangia bacterium]|nr:hypothetical protein [Polyangia bacterium]